MGLVIEGVNEGHGGWSEGGVRLSCASWIDEPRVPRLARGKDSRPRSTQWVRGIVLHTTKGIPGGRDRRPQVVRPGLGPPSDADLKCARFWSSSAEHSGAHLVVDCDGSIVCTADLAKECAFHAGPANDVSIGVEIFQGDDAELYADQLAIVVALCDWLTRRFGIQRQIPHRYRGRPFTRMAAGARNVVGVYGHRDVTDARGLGDPGDAIFHLLATAGYERRDFEAGEDLEIWRGRQQLLRAETQRKIDLDGIPGPATRQALLAAGRRHGQWVQRPGD